MKLIKCFETASMPKEVYDCIKDILSFGYDNNTVPYWVSKEEEWGEGEEAAYNWFIANGAEDGEKVIIERGTWQ